MCHHEGRIGTRRHDSDQRRFGVCVVQNGVQARPPRILDQVRIHFETQRTRRQSFEQLSRAETEIHGPSAYLAQYVLQVEMLDGATKRAPPPAQLARRVVLPEYWFGGHARSPLANRKR